jgi:hypothetical protein
VARQRWNYLVETGPFGVVREADLATCGHCNRQVVLTPEPGEGVICRVDPKCWSCQKVVCEECKRSLEPCKTWERRMEEQESHARLRRAIGV